MAHLQACRALMILSLLVGLASIVVSVLGLKCTKIGRTSEHAKDQMALTGGVLFILSGVFTLIAASWYAARVIHDFYNPLYGGVRFELGTGLYLGWAASCLAILGGSLLCCSCRKTSSTAAAARCTCGNCAKMPTEPENICCWETQKVKRRMEQLPDNISCMIEHPGLDPVCLNLFTMQNAYNVYRAEYGALHQRAIERQFTYNLSTTSRGQKIYRAAPASDSSSSKAYV